MTLKTNTWSQRNQEKVLAVFAIEVRRGDFPDQSWRRRLFREQLKTETARLSRRMRDQSSGKSRISVLL